MAIYWINLIIPREQATKTNQIIEFIIHFTALSCSHLSHLRPAMINKTPARKKAIVTIVPINIAAAVTTSWINIRVEALLVPLLLSIHIAFCISKEQPIDCRQSVFIVIHRVESLAGCVGAVSWAKEVNAKP